MSQGSGRVFDRAFKLAAIERMLAGENVSRLARQLGVRRKLLYEWRDAFQAGGAEALRGRGRPPAGSVVVGARRRSAQAAGETPPAPAASGVAAELAAARRRIAELERKVGQQALEADFFREALRCSEDLRRPSERPGASASTPSSQRGRDRKAD